MQQVAASNKDFAARGLFPGDTATSDVSGAGGDFAKVMESQNADANEQTYRGHGDFFDTPKEGNKRQVSLDEGAQKEVKIGDGFSDSFAKPPPEEGHAGTSEQTSEGLQFVPGDGKAQEPQTDAHEEWVSIIQKLKDGEVFNREIVAPDIPVDGQGTDILAGHGAQGEGDLSDNPLQDLVAQSGVNTAQISTADPSLTENTILIEELELADEPVLIQTELMQTEKWKEELKQKLLSSGQPFSQNQLKAIEKDFSGLSDTEIQQLLDNDPALKQMLSDIMSAQEQQLDPQDVALLMALSGEAQNIAQDGSQNIESVSGDSGVEVAVSPGDSTDTAQLETQQETPDGSDGTLDAELEQLIRGAELQSASQPEQLTATQQIPVSELEAKPQQAASDVQSTAKEPKQALEKMLSELDTSLQSDKQKVATLENLTQRVESSELAQTPAGKSFVETMKSATSEFKEQLKSGHEPGININKLVTEAVNAEAGNAEAVALEGQVRGAVQKMVDVAQAHLSLEPATRENLVSSFQSTLSNRESNLAQVEAGKAQQQNLQNQILDKAVNINKPEAAQDLANKVQVMMNQKNMVADIRLDPPDLGQMQIKIALQGDSASVSMVVQSQAAREALEHSEPRLKELLEQQGIELGQSSVQQESRGNKGEGDGSNYASGKGSEALDDLAGDAEHEQVVTMDEPDGIDYFA